MFETNGLLTNWATLREILIKILNYTGCVRKMAGWVLLVFATTVYGISRISEPDFTAVNFAKAREGRRLNSSVIKAMNVDSEGACRLQCVNEERCRSYNFGITKNKPGKFLCQLTDSDRFAGFSNFKEDDNFKYKGIQVTATERRNENSYNIGRKCYTQITFLFFQTCVSWLVLDQNRHLALGIISILKKR